MTGEYANEWLDDATTEYNALIRNGTWKLVPREPGMKVLRNRWIFRVKYLASGEIERFKARLVIKGFMQIYGIDYLEVYSPVVRLESIRVLLTLAAIWDYEVDQMDITTAFLNGDIDVEVYMEQPEGYAIEGKKTWVCLLQKSLYGLKQAPRVWFRLLKDYLQEEGYTLMNCEACVAVKAIDGHLMFISIYVDDLILFAPNKKLMKQLKQVLNKRFEMKDLEPIHFILGWEIKRDRTIFINQHKYVDKVLSRFGMENCNGCKVPSAVDLKPSKVMCPTTNEEKELMSGKPYRAVIGSLMYLMLDTRPDLAYLVRECSQFLENPGILHWRAAKCGLRYLKDTMNWGLRLGGAKWSEQKLNDHLKAFADADFANRVDDRKSIAGYLTQLCGSTISWSSQTEKTVALHTTEAEYMALSLLVQEVIHLRQMLKELKIKQQFSSEVFVDNESARKLANNPEFHYRAKHIDVRHHFVREHVEMKQIAVKRIPGIDNVADAFTKPLARKKFEQHRASMSVVSQTEYENTKEIEKW
ncbi:LOW QUALITY PROTEIN: Integrase catalytic core protein [Phytophthora palmivora]|uniref:Integrase catalytic core protein n=1 Tax=Phytophthora palmivora TaxID=4796 RepID=A0A2P4WYY5_9STRA|nr:LOW QUALITY PROTEIN: Integrase catalytic core protein [Phytophthora palmivora]